MSFFLAKLPEKAKKIEILPRFQTWMKKTNIVLASFIILKIWKLLIQKLEQASPTVTDDSTTRAINIFRVRVSCITPVVWSIN